MSYEVITSAFENKARELISQGVLFDPCEIRRLENGKRVSKRLEKDIVMLGKIMYAYAQEQNMTGSDEVVKDFIDIHNDMTLHKTYFASLRYWTVGRYISGLDLAFNQQMFYLNILADSKVYRGYCEVRST